jgi:hypothetical protein
MALSRRLATWLLTDADPSVRVRVLRGLFARTADDPALVVARRQVGRVGWAERILAEQLPSGAWASPGTDGASLYRPKYIATNWRLLVLADLGVSGQHPGVRRAVDLFLRAYSTGDDAALGGPSSEACFTGNAVRMLTAFGRQGDPRTQKAIDWLVRRQKPDGGWHCGRSRTGTLDAWEPLAAFSALPPPTRSPAVDRAVARGAEFFLERGLLREGRRTYVPWLRLHYPTHYYYDLLVGLSLLVRLGYGRDRRLRRPLDLLEAKRNPDGSWNLDALHPDSEDPGYPIRGPFYPFGLEVPGRPSRWVTTIALEVLRACDRI